jgi:hypothetical protein
MMTVRPSAGKRSTIDRKPIVSPWCQARGRPLPRVQEPAEAVGDRAAGEEVVAALLPLRPERFGKVDASDRLALGVEDRDAVDAFLAHDPARPQVPVHVHAQAVGVPGPASTSRRLFAKRALPSTS